MKLKSIPFSIRAIYVYLFFLSIIVLGTSIYLQFGHKLDPCPLCILQRFTFLLISVLCITEALHNPHRLGQIIYGVCLAILSFCGILVSSRQVWLQHFPNEATSCGAGLTYLLKTLPLTDTIKLIFQGSGECEVVGPRFFYLTISEWSLLLFIIFFITAIYLIWRSKTKSLR